MPGVSATLSSRCDSYHSSATLPLFDGPQSSIRATVADECELQRFDYTTLLPSEIALYIFKFLPLEDVARMGQTNWFWADAARVEYRYNSLHIKSTECICLSIFR